MRRRAGSESRKKIIFAIAAVITALLAAFLFFYRTVHEEEWLQRGYAQQTVTSNTYLTHVDKVETFVGDRPYQVVFGTDEAGKAAIAWVNEDHVHMEYAEDGVSEEWVRNKVSEEHPGAEIMRAIPGVLDGTYLWEVFYKVQEDDGVRYMYNYYRFTDGEKIDTWRLSKRI